MNIITSYRCIITDIYDLLLCARLLCVFNSYRPRIFNRHRFKPKKNPTYYKAYEKKNNQNYKVIINILALPCHAIPCNARLCLSVIGHHYHFIISRYWQFNDSARAPHKQWNTYTNSNIILQFKIVVLIPFSNIFFVDVVAEYFFF